MKSPDLSPPDVLALKSGDVIIAINGLSVDPAEEAKGKPQYWRLDDAIQKSVGKPVYQLLGGKCRDKVRVFANVGGETVEQFAASAAREVERGYTSLRTTPFLPGWEAQTPSRYIGQAVEIVKAIRGAVGVEIDLGLEIHRNLGLEEAIVLAGELAPYRILYYEDPLRPESIDAMNQLAKSVRLPLVTGERLYSLYQFKDLLDTRTCSMIRFDLSLAGGYTQCKKIAALAEASFVGAFPHLMGSPLNMAAYVQLDAAIPNYQLQENWEYGDRLNEILEEPLVREIEDGHYVACHFPLGAPEAPPRDDLLSSAGASPN
jgi:galactonate dehydratase